MQVGSDRLHVEESSLVMHPNYKWSDKGTVATWERKVSHRFNLLHMLGFLIVCG
jgi:hypothetical protein